MANDPQNAYKSTQIETSSQEQLLLMLYDGALKYMRQAKNAIKNDNLELSHEKLVNSQDIVTELMTSLDMDTGGEIADELYRLYDYVRNQLIQANVNKSVDEIDKAIPIMKELQEAWDEIINERGYTVEKARKEVMQNQSTDDDSDSTNEVDTNGTKPTQSQTANTDSSSDSVKQYDPGSSSNKDVTYGDISITR